MRFKCLFFAEIRKLLMFANSGSKMNNLPILIATWTSEAVVTHGFDWEKISAYLDRKIASLTSEERSRLDEEAKFAVCVHPEREREIN